MKYGDIKNSRSKDLTFQSFGKWKTTDLVEKIGNYMAWLCDCECGRTSKYINASVLLSNRSTQCQECREDIRIKAVSTIDGDSQKESKYHGLFVSHYNMMNRCYRKKDKSYQYYGYRGVSVCLIWHDYIEFKKWALENGWKRGLVISRRGDTGNYFPLNASWKTRSENSVEAHLGKPSKKRKLSKEQVISIRNSENSHNALAIEFDVAKATIQTIKSGKSYKDIL